MKWFVKEILQAIFPNGGMLYIFKGFRLDDNCMHFFMYEGSRAIEKTLKDVMSEATGNIKLSLSSRTAEMDLQKEIEICEKQKQEHVCSQIDCEKKVLDNHKRKLLKTGNVLNRKICELKVLYIYR